MLWNQGHFDELSPQCQKCFNRRCVSLFMNNDAIYGCGTYPLKFGEKCPKYEPIEKEEEKKNK